MNLEDTRKLINSVIDNEFAHIQYTQEKEELDTNVEINAKSIEAGNVLRKLLEVAPEHRDLIDEVDSASAAYWISVCTYYFKKGVIAGTTNLKFLEKTNVMEII